MIRGMYPKDEVPKCSNSESGPLPAAHTKQHATICMLSSFDGVVWAKQIQRRLVNLVIRQDVIPIHRPHRLRRAVSEIAWWLICTVLIMFAAVMGQRIDDYGEGE